MAQLNAVNGTQYNTYDWEWYCSIILRFVMLQIDFVCPIFWLCTGKLLASFDLSKFDSYIISSWWLCPLKINESLHWYYAMVSTWLIDVYIICWLDRIHHFRRLSLNLADAQYLLPPKELDDASWDPVCLCIRAIGFGVWEDGLWKRPRSPIIRVEGSKGSEFID